MIGKLPDHGQNRIDPTDAGALLMAITPDRKHRLVRLDFGTQLTWIAMDPATARALIAKLLAAVKEIER